MNAVTYTSPLSRHLNCLRESVSLKSQGIKTVPKNGATVAKAIFKIVCAQQWNI